MNTTSPTVNSRIGWSRVTGGARRPSRCCGACGCDRDRRDAQPRHLWMTRARVLVPCVGNTLRGDDGFGIAVAAALGGALPEGADLIETGSVASESCTSSRTGTTPSSSSTPSSGLPSPAPCSSSPGRSRRCGRRASSSGDNNSATCTWPSPHALRIAKAAAVLPEHSSSGANPRPATTSRDPQPPGGGGGPDRRATSAQPRRRTQRAPARSVSRCRRNLRPYLAMTAATTAGSLLGAHARSSPSVRPERVRHDDVWRRGTRAAHTPQRSPGAVVGPPLPASATAVSPPTCRRR